MQHGHAVDISLLLALPNTEGIAHFPGYHRPVKAILTIMAELFLTNNAIGENSCWSGQEQGTLNYTVGGDGASVGRGDKDSTLWCVCLLNCNYYVESPNDNFFSAVGCSGDHPAFLQYAKQLKKSGHWTGRLSLLLLSVVLLHANCCL